MAVNEPIDSVVEDALARVLWAAYRDASQPAYGGQRNTIDVSEDEKILRQALFGDKPVTGER